MHDFYPRNNYSYSFATHTNCPPLGHGSFQWCGDAGNGTVKCATGTSCSDARQTFCNRHGPGGGKCYGDKGAPRSSQQLGHKIHHTDANPLGGSSTSNVLTGGSHDGGLVGGPLDNLARMFQKGNTAGSSKDPGTPCDNCGNDWWNPGQWACQFGKLGCEAQHGAGKIFGGFPLPLIALAGGGIILLLILIKRR
jgi:hypothetical protein